MSVWLLFIVVSIIVLAVVAMATLVIVLVRRTEAPPSPAGPVAAPGQPDHRVAAARLVAELDDAANRASTSLDFARLQLSSPAPDELAAAVSEARASVSALSATIAETSGAQAHGPAGTDAAGRLSGALQRADAARHRLAGAEARVQQEAREIGPPG